MNVVNYFSLVVGCAGRICKYTTRFKIGRMSSPITVLEEMKCSVAKVNIATSGCKENSSDKTHISEQKSNGSCVTKEGDISIDRMIRIDTTPYTIVNEGKAEVLFPSSHDVFYNPVQEFNRDLSIAVMKQFIKTRSPPVNQEKVKSGSKTSSHQGVNVLEALAASGLRSIRYAKEVPGINNIVANDRSSQAYESIERNIRYNNIEDLVTPSNEDASLLMYQHRAFKKRFDVIDLDPYGTASPFLDAAVQSVSDGGLLMVTCTDMAVLCGNSPEATNAKYGAVSLKSSYCHEMALRIVLQSIESHANRYGRYIEPILSLSVDFYVRVFVKIFSGPINVKKSLCKLGMVYDCVGCGSFHVMPLGRRIETERGQKFLPAAGPPVNKNCEICGERHKIGGPIWIAGLHNKDAIQQIVSQVEEEHDKYATTKRILGVLNVVLEELDDCPLFYRLDRLCRAVHISTPSALQFRSAILNAGYRVSLSHVMPVSVKTDAPPEVIWDIIRTWVKHNPGKRSLELEPSKTILSKEPSIEVSFELHPDANPESRAKSLLRFQLNPQPFWGPKCRATTSLWTYKDDEKRKNCQSKRKQKKKEGKDLKQFPCKKFKQNECDKGDECKYSHETPSEA